MNNLTDIILEKTAKIIEIIFHYRSADCLPVYIISHDMPCTVKDFYSSQHQELFNIRMQCFEYSLIVLPKSACLGYEARLAEPQTSQKIAFLGNQVNKVTSKFQPVLNICLYLSRYSLRRMIRIVVE